MKRSRFRLSSISSDGVFLAAEDSTRPCFGQIPVAQLGDIHLLMGAASLFRRVSAGADRTELDLGQIARLIDRDHVEASDLGAAKPAFGIHILDDEGLRARGADLDTETLIQRQVRPSN